MKHFYFIICLFILSTSQAQTTQDTLYVWKAGQLVIKQSIKPADMDSITFKRPVLSIPNVSICSQVWATRNLDVTTYSDGTPIPQVTDPTAWSNLTTGAWCYYNNDPSNNAVYGKLYNWYAAAGIYDSASLANPALRKNLAPTGWHIPTDAEWSTLINCLDPSANGGANTNVAGGAMKEAGIVHWGSPNNGATNSSGFTGLPGGWRDNSNLFGNLQYKSAYWSITESISNYSWVRTLNSTDISSSRNNYPKTIGFSVRCIKN